MLKLLKVSKPYSETDVSNCPSKCLYILVLEAMHMSSIYDNRVLHKLLKKT